MIDYACIFTTGGLVLWSKAIDDNSLKLDNIVNVFIKNVLLENKTMNGNSYAFEESILRWKM